jgi:arsenate reductase
MEIYHNPRCRKSRETLQLLEDKGHKPQIVLYLDKPPTKTKLKSILKMLDIKAQDLVRKTESIYKEQFKGKTLTEKEWIDALIDYPKLIERPIVINGDKAALGRPPEQVLNIL